MQRPPPPPLAAPVLYPALLCRSSDWFTGRPRRTRIRCICLYSCSRPEIPCKAKHFPPLCSWWGSWYGPFLYGFFQKHCAAAIVGADSSGSRERPFSIWSYLLGQICTNASALVHGFGICSTAGQLTAAGFLNTYAHNQWIQTLFDQGLLGLFFYAALMGACLFRNVRKQPLFACGLIATLVCSFSLSFYTNKPYLNVFMMCCMTFSETSPMRANKTTCPPHLKHMHPNSRPSGFQREESNHEKRSPSLSPYIMKRLRSSDVSIACWRKHTLFWKSLSLTTVPVTKRVSFWNNMAGRSCFSSSNIAVLHPPEMRACCEQRATLYCSSMGMTI